jgi:hypothetical protein
MRVESKMRHPIRKIEYLAIVALLLTLAIGSVSAVDSEQTRKTMAGLQGVYVLVEELQPNIQKYASKLDLDKASLQKRAESQLHEAGIRVLGREEWLKTPGRPVLYINVNTHEQEKYWFAYNIQVELQQVAAMEASPAIKSLVGTWSVNIAGMVNIGSVNALKDRVKNLMDIFITAYLSANPKKKF